MRQVRYNVVTTLDGYIAGPNGEFDWIPEEPTVDFASIFAKVDTVLLGRVSYDLVQTQPEAPWTPNTRVFVFSNTLEKLDRPNTTVVRGGDAVATVRALRNEPGDGDIWLFGGGALFRTLVDAGQVDTIEATVAPVLLGGGIPVLPPPLSARIGLTLAATHRYPSGLITLTYAVSNAEGA
ncbi:MAG TPA: dihydrofolate reductase family protein [Gemmatimonadaceae bacterium]|nr:dihydrofolate reductase family protein [Gemmatimonadaceae bacterium]